MGEQKRREAAGHVPPEGMANVSGRHVTELARGIMDLLEKPFDEGMQADIAAHVMVVTAVDLWRANYGDQFAAQALKRAIDRRLEKPMEYWGGKRGGLTMHIGRVAGATRNLGAPKDWDEAKDGICGGLPIRDEPHSPGVNRMVSAWLPTIEEIALMVAGAPIYLSVVGTSHPPVWVFVGEPPADDAAEEVARG